MHQELEVMKRQRAKITSIMLNLTDLEDNQVQSQINEITQQQEIAMVKQEISEYSVGVKFLIGKIGAKQLHELHPTTKRAEYVNRLRKEIMAMVFPEVEPLVRIFEVHPVVIWLENDLVTVEYLIPFCV